MTGPVIPPLDDALASVAAMVGHELVDGSAEEQPDQTKPARRVLNNLQVYAVTRGDAGEVILGHYSHSSHSSHSSGGGHFSGHVSHVSHASHTSHFSGGHSSHVSGAPSPT